MQLKPVENSYIKTIVPWMTEEQNYQWLDFGSGVQKLEAPALKMMTQRKIHELRLFTADDSDKPVGLVALSDINENFNTAVLWYVLGDKNHAGKNYTTKAVSKMLTLGFDELGLKSIFAWAIEKNIASIKVLEKNNFKFIGKRRKCHYINGQAYDRMYYDILSEEHNKLNEKTTGENQLTGKVMDLLSKELEVEIPSTDTDLIENGYIDSLRFIQLMAVLEEKFGITISIEDLDFESFTTVEKIALFVDKQASKN